MFRKKIFLKKLLLFLITFCVLILYVYWNLLTTNSSTSKYGNHTQTNQIANIQTLQAAISPECFLKTLDEWDPKIKNLFKKLPIYDKCKKNAPFTFIKNSTIYFDLNVNVTHYQGLFI